jgi:hypothetical protein
MSLENDQEIITRITDSEKIEILFSLPDALCIDLISKTVTINAPQQYKSEIWYKNLYHIKYDKKLVMIMECNGIIVAFEIDVCHL